MSIRDKPLYVRYKLATYLASKVWNISYWIQNKANDLEVKAHRLEYKLVDYHIDDADYKL